MKPAMSGNSGKSSVSLSMRGGALVLKSISLFLASSRKSAASASAASTSHAKTKPPKKKTKKMQDTKNKNKITPKLLETIKKETHFTRSEIESLYRIYKQLISVDRNKSTLDKSLVSGGVMHKPTLQEGLNRNVFSELIHNTFGIVTEDIVVDRIFTVWDTENAGVLTLRSWFQGLSMFLKGTLEEQIKFCFAVYDMNADGYVTKEEIFILLRNCLIKHSQDDDPDESVKELVEIVSKKMDLDADGKVSQEDFTESVLKVPLLLQAFSPCLPTKAAAETFLTTLS